MTKCFDRTDGKVFTLPFFSMISALVEKLADATILDKTC